MLPIQEFIASVSTQLTWLLVFIAADFVMGVIDAIASDNKKFAMEEIPKTVLTNGVYVVAWLIAAFISLAPAEVLPEESIAKYLPYFGLAVYGLVSLKQIGSIGKHFASLGLAAGLLDKIGIRPN